MVIMQTLDDFLQELMLTPGEVVAYFDNKKAAVYLPESEEFVFMDGDFSGSVTQNRAELQRHLNKMGY